MGKQVATCTAPDRHAPRLVCGYPLPCPHHTVLVVFSRREKGAQSKRRKATKRGHRSR